MMILAVHTTTPRLSVAIALDGRVIHEKALSPGREHLENLAPVVRDVIGHTKIRLEDVHGFGVAIGPGSFSGIRVGLATVKGIALALGKPVVGVSSLEILAWQGLGEGEVGASVIDARRGEVFAGIYRKSENKAVLMQGPLLIKADLFRGLLEQINHDSPAICSERAIDSLSANLWDSHETRIVIPSASACAILAEERFKGGVVEDVHSLAPLYIRRSDAEEKCKIL